MAFPSAKKRFILLATLMSALLGAAASGTDAYRDMTAEDLTGSWRLMVDDVEVEMVAWPGVDAFGAPRLIALYYTPQYDCLRVGSIVVSKFPNKVYGHTDHYGARLSEPQFLVLPDWKDAASDNGDCLVQTANGPRAGSVGLSGWMGISPDGVISSDVMQTAHKNPEDPATRYWLGEEESAVTLQSAPVSDQMARWLDQVANGDFRKISLEVYPLDDYRGSF